jgi:hypothetical protein
VFRRLSADLGETWTLRILGRDGSTVAEQVMSESPSYLDRRESFKISEWADGYYVVRNRLGKETFRLDVSRYV